LNEPGDVRGDRPVRSATVVVIVTVLSARALIGADRQMFSMTANGTPSRTR